ncbi:MAG: PKD domain-containing protein [Flavobacteriales bacterium]
MLKKLLFTFITLFVFYQSSMATHIVGGSLTYEHLGGASYRLMLRLYRDCSPNTVPTPINLGTSATVAIYYGNGAFYQNVSLPRVFYDVVTPNLDTCVADPGICVQEGLFTAIVNNLPPASGGYHLYYETCCRNGSVQNIVNPTGNPAGGQAFYCRITDNTQLLTNSSPQWINPPPVFVCQGENINFNHGATDVDGDSLAYSFYTPFRNGGITFTAGNPNINTVTWIANFNANNPLDVTGGSSLSITPGGIIQGIPPALGQYVAGIRVDEYRDGVIIGSVFRDFQFNVVVCPPPALADIGPIDACSGTTINFQNTSTPNANGFLWDFGNAGATSTQTDPTYTYPGFGTYTVTLIAQQGTACADTATKTFTINELTADWNSADTACIGSPINFSDASVAGTGSTITNWNWNFGNGNTSISPTPSQTYNVGGGYNVSLVVTTSAGCVDTVVKPIFIQSLPTANTGPDASACNTNPLINLSGLVSNATGGIWTGGNGSYNPNNSSLATSYTPTQLEIGNGVMQLYLTTTGNGYCPSTTDTITITFVAGPSVNAGPDIQVCKDTAFVPLNGAVTIAGGGLWTTSGTGSFSPSDDQLITNYIPSQADTASGSLTIYLTSTFNGNCIAVTDSLLLSFYDPPTATILNNNIACAGNPIPLIASVTTGSGYWSTNGTGTFIPDSTLTSTYMPSAQDLANGSITVVFISTDNGGCRAASDTLDITLIPSPIASFSFTEVCLNQATSLTDNSTSPGNLVAWEWNFGDGSPNSFIQNPSYTFSNPGSQNITLYVTSNNGCIDSLTQTILVHYLPEVGFFSNNPCWNGGSEFTDLSTVIGAAITEWDWSFGDAANGSSSSQNPTYQYNTAGVYNVTLTATSSFGCTNSLTQSTTILPGPIANFNMSNTSVNPFTNIDFTDLSQPNIIDWSWDFGDGQGTSSDQNPSYTYTQGGVNTITLVVTDTNGCIDTIQKDIVIFLPPSVPSGFSPNGDGQNDMLYVYGGPFIEFEFKIYNNWGQLIFTSTEQATGWDGTFKNEPQPLGVFVYTVKAITADNVEHIVTGDVTLIR